MKLLAIEGNPLIREGMRHMIGHPYPNCHVIEADTGEDGVFVALTQPVDLILLSLGVSWRRGEESTPSKGLAVLDALRYLTDPPPAIVMSEATKKARPATSAWQRGAAAVIPKDAAPEALLEAIGACLKGRELVPTGPTRTLRSLPASIPPSLSAADLSITPRMFEVLKLALQGHPSKKIAQLLDINSSNVRRYLSRLYEKFDVAGLNGLQAQSLVQSTGRGVPRRAF